MGYWNQIRKHYDVSTYCRSYKRDFGTEVDSYIPFRRVGRENDVGAVKRSECPGQTAEWAINDRMPHADEPLFSSNRHCNMKHRQLPDKIIIRLITCQLQMLVVCLLIYSSPRSLQFQRCHRRPSLLSETHSCAKQKIVVYNENAIRVWHSTTLVACKRHWW